LIRGAEPTIEILEIRSATQRDVLAVVNFLSAGQRVRRRATAEMGPFFQQTHTEAGFSQRDGRGKAR
jgi:uncharacterized coiled-coil protein SlyX